MNPGGPPATRTPNLLIKSQLLRGVLAEQFRVDFDRLTLPSQPFLIVVGSRPQPLSLSYSENPVFVYSLLTRRPTDFGCPGRVSRSLCMFRPPGRAGGPPNSPLAWTNQRAQHHQPAQGGGAFPRPPFLVFVFPFGVPGRGECQSPATRLELTADVSAGRQGCCGGNYSAKSSTTEYCEAATRESCGLAEDKH